MTKIDWFDVRRDWIGVKQIAQYLNNNTNDKIIVKKRSATIVYVNEEKYFFTKPSLAFNFLHNILIDFERG